MALKVGSLKGVPERPERDVGVLLELVQSRPEVKNQP